MAQQQETADRTRSTAMMLIALVVGGVTAILDTTIVTIGLDTLTAELHVPVSTIQWVSTAYLLALAVAIPFVSWAQARFGGKRLWVFALGLFVLGSVLCACSLSAHMLIAARVIQGLGGGIMLPLMQTLAMQNVAPENRIKTMATVALPAALGPIIGPVLGGIVLHWLSWPWLFLINVPIGVVGLILAALCFPADRPTRQTGAVRARSPHLDIVGALLLSPALAALLFGLSNSHADGGFARTDVLVPGIVGVLLLGGFIVWARHRGDGAIVDIGLFRLRSVGVSSLVLLFGGAVLLTGSFLLPLWLQQRQGLSVLAAALVLIPQGVGSLVARVLTPALVKTLGPRGVTGLGFLVVAAATLPFLGFGASGSTLLMGIVLFVRGLGLGVVLIPVMSGAYADTAHDQMPHASAITRISQQLGGAFGTALIAVVLTAGHLGGGFDPALWAITAITAAAAVLALLLPRSTASPETS